jgi:peptidoglycan/xylan/chitin deacetylase (PgdA/CDA1 family)
MFILLYHQINVISEDRDPLRLAVSPDLFAREMQYLKTSGYQCVSLEALAKMMLNGERIPDNYFAITFDDGYQDNYDNAYPVLREYGFTATIFLVPDRVGSTPKWEGVSARQDFPLMAWDAARELSAKGIDFGSHTQTHAMLTKQSEKEVFLELESSKHSIEKELGKTVRLFAFPYEKAEPALQPLVEKAGYLAACGSLLYPQNRFNLWRTECVGSDTLSDFRYKISKSWRRSVIFKYHSPFGRAMRFVRRQVKSMTGRAGGFS